MCEEWGGGGDYDPPDDGGDGGDGSGSGSYVDSHDGIDYCPNCTAISSQMKLAMKEALEVVSTQAQCQLLKAEAVALIDAGEWGHREQSLPAGHSNNAHTDDTRFHFYIDTTHGGFPWTPGTWDPARRQAQLAGTIIHETLHHRYDLPLAEEHATINPIAESCVPGYVTGAGDRSR